METKNGEEKETAMKSHWVMLAVVLLVGYLIGVKFPSTGQALLSKVGA